MRWKACHSGKRRFASKREAWWMIARIAWREKRIEPSFHPYVCHWTHDYQAGRSGPGHIHIGHSGRKTDRTPKGYLLYRWRRGVVWPYYRMRRRCRRLRKVMAG